MAEQKTEIELCPNDTATGSFTFYRDNYDGRYFFTCWNEPPTSCGVHSVEEERAKREINSLETTRINRTARGEHLAADGKWRPKTEAL